MINLSEKWAPILISSNETGMGYQIATIVLVDGRIYKQAIIQSGVITKVRGFNDIPFKENEISEILVSHEKWDFNAG